MAEHRARGEHLAAGARLAQFETLGEDLDLSLSPTEQAYLEASLAERERQQAQERLRVAHEASLERRSRNVWRALVVVLLLATLGALALTGLAWDQSRIARKNEVSAQGLALNSGAQFAASRGNSELALALALAANRLDPSNVQAQLTLSDLAYAPGIRRRLVGHMDQVSVAFAPDGGHAISGSWDKTLILWDLGNGQPCAGSPGIRVRSQPSPSARIETALSGSTDKTMILWT
jgi:hypothetical protein